MCHSATMSLGDYETFAASMPAAYHEFFDGEAVEAHAAIASRREGGATRVEIWRDLPDRVVAICIVADDRPGLLSQISAALVAERIDVVSAHAYCRTRPDGTKEAVDLLWIRRVAAATDAIAHIRAHDVAAFGKLVDALVGGKATVEEAIGVARASVAAQASTRVLFDDTAKDGTMVLTVEATDRPGLLLLVTQAIFRAKLQIIGLRATSEAGRAIERLHLAELDGKPLGLPTLLALQDEIFAAIESDGAAA